MGKRLLEELAGHISATRSMLPASDAKLGMGMLSFTVDQEIFVMVPEQLGKDKYEVRDNAARLLQKENADTFVIGGFLASGVRTENLSQDYGGSLHDHPDAFEVMLFVGGDKSQTLMVKLDTIRGPNGDIVELRGDETPKAGTRSIFHDLLTVELKKAKTIKMGRPRKTKKVQA